MNNYRLIKSFVVGTLLLESLVACSNHYLKLEDFKTAQILETRLWED
jgi:glutamate formiminotransferase